MQDNFTIKTSFFVTILVIFVTVLFFEYSDVDNYFQSFFFNSTTKTWYYDQHDWAWWVFYKSKIAIVLFGVFLIGLSIKRPSQRKLILMGAIALVPLTVAIVKKYSNIYCPYALELYGGDKPYVRLFGEYEVLLEKPGRCFPAGHASGGFAFMALYYYYRERSKKLIGLFVGIALGLIMGMYQIARGHHFLSDTLVTMELAWLVIIIINYAVKRCFSNIPFE